MRFEADAISEWNKRFGVFRPATLPIKAWEIVNRYRGQLIDRHIAGEISSDAAEALEVLDKAADLIVGKGGQS